MKQSLSFKAPFYQMFAYIQLINYLFYYLFNTGGTQNTVSEEQEMDRKCYSTLDRVIQKKCRNTKITVP